METAAPSNYSATEFAVQRWCRFAPGDKLWAFLPRFATAVWPRLMDDAGRMMQAIAPEAAERLLADPGWTSLDPYWARLKAGPTRLDDPEGLAALFDGIEEGARSAAAAAGLRAPETVSKPARSAPIEIWDAAVAHHLEALLGADRRWRRRSMVQRLIVG